MDRLKTEEICCIPRTIEEYDRQLKIKIGKTLVEMAEYISGAQVNQLKQLKIAVVPITAGKGIIHCFSDTVAAILEYIGMDVIVTQNTDVAGFAEAFSNKADIIFAGDDTIFSAFDINNKRFIDNSFATGRVYAIALELAAGGLEGKQVFVIGAGQVGLSAIDYLVKSGAKVFVKEIDRYKISEIKKRYKNDITIVNNLSEALNNSKLIFVAAPITNLLDEDNIDSETIISAPALPIGLTKSALKKLPSSNLIHDPLQLGVVAMVAMALK